MSWLYNMQPGTFYASDLDQADARRGWWDERPEPEDVSEAEEDAESGPQTKE